MKTHLTISSSKCSVTRPAQKILDQFLQRQAPCVLESTENLGGPLVQYIDLIVDVTVCGKHQVRAIQAVQKTKEVALGRFSHSRNRHACGHTAKVQESTVLPQDCSTPEIFGATVLHDSPTGSALILYSQASGYPQCKLWRELTGRGVLRSSSCRKLAFSQQQRCTEIDFSGFTRVLRSAPNCSSLSVATVLHGD